MATAPKQPAKQPGSEGWYDVGGKRRDAAIHEPILEGEHPDAHAVGVSVATRIGLDAAERDSLFGNVEQDRLADEAGRRDHRARVYAKHRAAHLQGRAVTADFDPDEGRDEHGRWTKGGGSGSSGGVKHFARGDRVAVKPDHHATYAKATPPLNVAGKIGTVKSTLIGNSGRRHFVSFDEPINEKGGTGASFPEEHLQAAAAPVNGPNENEQMRAALGSGKPLPDPERPFGGRRGGPFDKPKNTSALSRAEEAITRAFAGREKVSGIEVPPGTDYVEAFHGTTKEVVDNIRKNGLVPHASPGADKWAEEHDMPTAQLFEAGDRMHSVYIVSAANVAGEFAKIAAEERGQTPIILKVHIPVDEAKKNLVPDEMSQSNRGGVAFARYNGTIKPSWIVDRFSPDVVPGVGRIELRGRSGQLAGASRDDAAVQEVYLIVFDPLAAERKRRSK